MSLNIKIECLREPELIFGAGELGVEPRRIMAKAGAADKPAARKIRIGLVDRPRSTACPALAATSQQHGHRAGEERASIS